MATINKQQIATFAQYSETLNANNELQIVAKDGPTDITQTLNVSPPCLVVYDATNFNFYAIPLSSFEQHWKFVEVISAIT